MQVKLFLPVVCFVLLCVLVILFSAVGAQGPKAPVNKSCCPACKCGQPDAKKPEAPRQAPPAGFDAKDDLKEK